MKFSELKTPAFLIDLEKVKANTTRMIERARGHGLVLRPHVKTHKTVEGARLQVGDGPGCITVSTLAEARYFLEAGFKDITYAFPITPNKLTEAAELAREADRFNLLVDHWSAAAALLSFARSQGIRFDLFLKVDPGLHRAGVEPESDEAVMLAQQLHADGSVRFRGILTHGGHAYGCKGPDEIRGIAREEREVMVRFGGRLAEGGIPCPEVSVGSTPTAVLGEGWEGVTELRPGNYVFFDRFQVDVGTCSLDDCAATVAATVAGHYPARNQLLVDAGALALSKDRGAVHLGGEAGFGTVLGHPDLKVSSLSQEHGLIGGESPIPYGDFPIGCVVRIIPNHSCLAAALFPKYHVLEGDEVVAEWIPVRGW